MDQLQDGETAQIVKLVLLLSVLGAVLLGGYWRRRQLGTALRHALVWVAIFGAVALLALAFTGG